MDHSSTNMFSKYSLTAKNKPNVSESIPFSSHLKRKFVYCSPSSAPKPKIANIQNVPKLSNPSTTQNSAQNGSADKSAVIDIQMQRKKLPAFAVREQYVNITTMLFRIICMI